MNTQVTTVKRKAQARSGPFYIQRNFQPGRPCADMVRRLLLAHQAV